MTKPPLRFRLYNSKAQVFFLLHLFLIIQPNGSPDKNFLHRCAYSGHNIFPCLDKIIVHTLLFQLCSENDWRFECLYINNNNNKRFIISDGASTRDTELCYNLPRQGQHASMETRTSNSIILSIPTLCRWVSSLMCPGRLSQAPWDLGQCKASHILDQSVHYLQFYLVDPLHF